MEQDERRLKIEFHKVTLAVLETEDSIAAVQKQATQLEGVLKIQKARELEISNKLAALKAASQE